MKTPRGQAWPAETQKSEAASGSPVNRHPTSEPVLRRGLSQRRWTGKGGQTVMTQINTTTTEMLMLDKWQTGGKNQATVERSGMRMQGPLAGPDAQTKFVFVDVLCVPGRAKSTSHICIYIYIYIYGKYIQTYVIVYVLMGTTAKPCCF